MILLPTKPAVCTAATGTGATTGDSSIACRRYASGDLWVVFNDGHIEKIDGSRGSVVFKTEVTGTRP